MRISSVGMSMAAACAPPLKNGSRPGWKSRQRHEKVRPHTSTEGRTNGRSERGRHPRARRTAPRPDRGGARRHSRGPRGAEAARAPRGRSRSSPAASSRSTGSSRRSGRGSRLRPPRMPSRSTSPSSARRSARDSRRARRGTSSSSTPERVDVHRFSRSRRRDAPLSRAEIRSRPKARCARRSRSGAGRRSRTSSTSRSPRPRSRGSRSSARCRSRSAIEADLALGRHAELVSELEALVQAQPLRERPRAQLMLALYRSGRQADALAAYRAARETLVEELGIDPGPELRELEAAILRQDDSLLLEEAPLARPGDAVPPARHDPLRRRRRVDGARRGTRPEALGRVLQSYFETVSAAIMRHGGAVEKYAGDAVMAAFGIPVSHEDDALRAARAALDIRAGIAALNEQLAHAARSRARGQDRDRDGRGRRDADRRAPASRHRRGGRHRGEAGAGGRRGRDRGRQARRATHRPRGGAGAARRDRDQGQARAGARVPAGRARPGRARVRAASGGAARRPQARARGAAARR